MLGKLKVAVYRCVPMDNWCFVGFSEWQRLAQCSNGLGLFCFTLVTNECNRFHDVSTELGAVRDSKSSSSGH